MPIPIECECGSRYSVDEKHAGRKIRCPKCAATIPVPDLTSPTSAADAGPNPTAEGRPIHEDRSEPNPAEASLRKLRAYLAISCASLAITVSMLAWVLIPRRPPAGPAVREPVPPPVAAFSPDIDPPPEPTPPTLPKYPRVPVEQARDIRETYRAAEPARKLVILDTRGFVPEDDPRVAVNRLMFGRAREIYSQSDEEIVEITFKVVSALEGDGKAAVGSEILDALTFTMPRPKTGTPRVDYADMASSYRILRHPDRTHTQAVALLQQTYELMKEGLVRGFTPADAH